MNYGKALFAARMARSLDMRRGYDRFVAKAIAISFGIWCMGAIAGLIAFVGYVLLTYIGWVA